VITSPRLRLLAARLAAGPAACAGSETLTLAQQAGKLQREGKQPEAYAAYGAALCAEPSSLALALELVQAWDALGQPGSPRAQLDDCPLDGATAAYLDGLADAAGGHTTEAEARLAEAEEATSDKARKAEIAYRRGIVAVRDEVFDEALASFERAAGWAPERVDIRLGMAKARLGLGQYAAVIDELRGMLSISPSPDDIQRGLQLVDATVRAAEPPLPEGIAADLEDLLSAIDRPQLDRPSMLRALDLGNELQHPRVLTVAGLAALRLGAESEGTKLLERAAALSPLDPDPPRFLGIYHYAAQRMAEALPYLRQAHQRNPLDDDVAQRLAEAATATGDHETARESYRALVILDPKIAEYRLRLARAERQLGDLDAAKRAVEAGYALDTKSIPMLLERAVINARLAHVAPTQVERDAAARLTRESVDELLEISPDHPGADSILQSLE